MAVSAASAPIAARARPENVWLRRIATHILIVAALIGLVAPLVAVALVRLARMRVA